MAAIIEDRIQETSTSTGTGNMVLAGAVLAHRTFSSVCSIGDTFYAMIVAVDANGAPTGQWESGQYTYSAANTITRTAVNANSLGTNALVNFATGIKRVFIDITATQVRTFQTNASSGTVLPYGQTASDFTGVIFQEEFDGNTLDTTRWNKAYFGQTDNPDQNFSVANSNLNIWPSSPFVDRTIDTDSKFYLNPGCFVEIEAKFPIGKGLQPALWLSNHDGAVYSVITIGKTFSGGTPTAGTPPGTGWATAQYHPIDYQMNAITNAGVTTVSQRGATYLTIPDLSLAFNKFGFRWENSGLSFYFNGVLVNAKVNTTAYTQRMYILLSVWYDTAPDTPDTTNTPQGIANALQINYVRAWQLA